MHRLSLLLVENPYISWRWMRILTQQALPTLSLVIVLNLARSAPARHASANTRQCKRRSIVTSAGCWSLNRMKLPARWSCWGPLMHGLDCSSRRSSWMPRSSSFKLSSMMPCYRFKTFKPSSLSPLDKTTAITNRRSSSMIRAIEAPLVQYSHLPTTPVHLVMLVPTYFNLTTRSSSYKQQQRSSKWNKIIWKRNHSK